MWDDTPEALRRSTNSRRIPRAVDGRWVQCGACVPCRQMVEAGVPLDRVVPVTEEEDGP